MTTKEKPEKSVNKAKWITTSKRYVCYIDIMGFKNMIATKKHSDIYKMMKKIASFHSFKPAGWLDKHYLIKTTTYSDSIIIYSANDDKDSLKTIVCAIAALSQELLSEGIPFKGALSTGLMTYDNKNSIYFGQPLIDAYLLQEELYYYGIIVHGSAQKKIEDYKFGAFIEEYNCPLKKGKSKHLTIPPIYLVPKSSHFDKQIKELINSVNNMKYSTSGHLRIYVDSTIDYINAIISKCKQNK